MCVCACMCARMYIHKQLLESRDLGPDCDYNVQAVLTLQIKTLCKHLQRQHANTELH